MWKEPDPDPGGANQEGASSAKPSQEFTDLKDQNEQQQLLIAQLKEMLRKEQSNVTQEKVEEYMNTLSKVTAKKSRTKRDESSTEKSFSSSTSSSVSISKKQKVNLLKQQLEENKAKLAERGKNQKGIEEMVTQLKAQLNDSQQLIPPNISIVDHKNLDYSKNSSQEELYNILLTKERKITDLLNKVQKQEVAILDLEENLKEKDSVIDARTKAITLMTDSLSKKGKSTLDALDDTKEQMRKMQENFITLESEMKARQVKLLNDLKAKNFEIAELQESNQKLFEERSAIEESRKNEVDSGANQIEEYKKNISELQRRFDQMVMENEENLSKISELEKNLKDSIDDLNRLKNTGLSVSTEQNDEENAKLKKQLEENNKNMIKVKAQSKSKIKELNKKLDQIKKSNDANALIVQLQNENTKLGEKIAELEEEKGNMQLKMVESSDSVKDSSGLEEQKELERKLAKYLEDLEEKDKIITLLDTEIISLKEETQSLNEKISDLAHLEHVEVSAEIKYIQLEEQLEKVECEKLKLKEDIEGLLKKKKEMTEQVEELKKEKQEISSKLDNYIQENMELIDKLEKLSAEKVSSAESIEIVEGLTQQEKLELAAYQKNLDVHVEHVEGELIKCTDDQIEPPSELNDSVLQLNEDSTELLQKIDMFNMERKEVMTKMEAIGEENNRLNMKLKEVENNRDILAETYEQLQTEKEVLQNENDELMKKLSESQQQTNISEKQSNINDAGIEVLAKLEELEREYEKLLKENESLKSTVKEYDMHIHEKHNLESEVKQAREKIDKLEATIYTNLEEISNYQSVIEENKNEFINSANIINDLQVKLNAKEKDIADLNLLINDLNEVVNNLQTENNKLANIEIMEAQVAELKVALTEQIQQAQEYEEEIARNNGIITDLNTKLIEMNKKIIETEQEMEKKDIEYKKLTEDLHTKNEIIQHLQRQGEDKDKKVGTVIQQMKEKYLSLQNQLDSNSGTLEAKIMELTNKNKEQIDKMKKIAANLKKKSQAYTELEQKYNEEKEKWETEVNEKQIVISNSQDKIATILQKIKDLENEVKVKNSKIGEFGNKITELTEVIQNLEENKMEMQNLITELKHREQKLSEVSLKQELSTSLHEDFDNIPSNQDSAKEEKIKELELIIETNDADIAHFSERAHKLEENVARLEQEKEKLVQETIQLNDQLNATSQSIEEKSFMEEELGQKLLQVTANDEALVRKLEEATTENKELIQKNRETEEINVKLKIKLKKAHERVTQLKSSQANMEELENANSELLKQLSILEANQKHIQDENQELQKQNKNDYEKIETDYQIQLEELVRCRNELQVECEKLQELLKDMEQREENLLSEIAEYKQRMEEINTNNKVRLEELTDELRAATFNYNDSVTEIAVLKEQNEYLEKELITKIARETVENIVTEAENRIRSMRTIGSQTDKVEDGGVEESAIIEPIFEIKSITSAGSRSENIPNQPETVPTFHWPGSQEVQQTNQGEGWMQSPDASSIQRDLGHDWFNIPSQINASEQNLFNPQQPAAIDNSKEELLNKIKALEFLLYSIDKEKEEAFQECTGMVNELTRLVYEKVNNPNKKTTSSSAAPLSGLESQIMSEVDIVDAASNKKELHDIEFEKTDASLGEQSHPVVEDVVQPQRAYLTYQPEDKVVKPEVFGENDDGWGWGPEEAKLEEEHQNMNENASQVQHLNSELARLNENLQVLQVERENHLEEIKQLQVKSGKLIKKCRELKQKNDHLMEKQQNKKTEGNDFLDLDAAIQEELKTQIVQLEKKIKETTNELEKEKQEKTIILKRVDVLTSANERMIEMKEIQDTEVIHWKRRCQEVEDKLQHHEWGSDGFNEGTKSRNISEVEASCTNDNKKIEELQLTIKELALDNDELQSLLEEQRQLRMDLEKAKTPHESDRMQEELKKVSALENRIKNLEQELTSKTEEMQTISNEKNSVFIQSEKLQKEMKVKEENLKELQENFKNAITRSNEFERLLTDTEKALMDLQENENNLEIQNRLNNKIKELESELLQLNQSRADQSKLLHEKETALDELQSSFEPVNTLKEELTIQVKQLTNDVEGQRQLYDKLQVEKSRDISELHGQLTKQSEYFDELKMELDGKINNLCSELEHQRQMNSTEVNTAAKLNELSQELEQQKQKYDQLNVEYIEKSAELAKVSQELQNKQLEFSAKDTLEWAQEKYQLESLLIEKEATIVKLKNQEEGLEKQVEELRHNLEQKQKDYEHLFNETEVKISKTAKELEESWIIQVDQRGADIAESWKLHLDTVEAEFASIQDKLKHEINELEEKCNSLVNENNELRKNVDAEIRNEVDRISALQQQITDCQRYITELNSTLIEKQKQNESLIEKLTVMEEEKERLMHDLKDKENRLSSLSIIVDTTQKQFDEKREVVEEVVRILEKNTSFPISFEKRDVLSEFQKQLNLINAKEQEIVRLNQYVENLQNQFTSVQGNEGEIIRLNQLVQDLQKQLDLLQEKDDEITRLNKLVDDSQNQLVLMHEKNDEVLNMHKLVEDLQQQHVEDLRKQGGLLHEKDEELLNMHKLVEDLQQQHVEDLRKQDGLLHEKDEELLSTNKLIQDLQQQLDSVKEKNEKINELNNWVEDLQEGFLRDKDGEIVRLNKIIDYKVQHELSQQELDQMRQEQVTANMTTEDYKRKLDELNTTYISLQSSVDEKNQMIASLNQQLQFTESLKNDNNKDIETLEQEVSQVKNDCSMLQQSLSDCQEQLFTINNELTNKTNQLEIVNQQLAYSQQNYEIQESELNKLRNLLQTKDQDYNSHIENLRRTYLKDLENHYQELLSAKDLDIETIKSQLSESIQNSNQLTEKLALEEQVRQQLESKVKELEEKIVEQSTLVDEEDKQLTEMRSIIEQQVIKIEELKKELFAKSSDYDSIIAEMDIGRRTITQQPTSSGAQAEQATTSQRSQLQEEDLTEPVSRAELDLALYMLHQRDVRCEELTVELTQLLEERDTLQLRLSNALREKEEVRRKLAGEEIPMPSTSTSPPVTPRSKSSAIFLSASGTELATEPLENYSDIQNLESKLSELRKVGYKKDKTFVDEQEFRRLQQMSIMQQHINEASKLPPEAAAKLVDASYTLSRDVQSPSKVLLNWLWGRSTPKVNDT